MDNNKKKRHKAPRPPKVNPTKLGETPEDMNKNVTSGDNTPNMLSEEPSFEEFTTIDDLDGFSPDNIDDDLGGYYPIEDIEDFPNDTDIENMEEDLEGDILVNGPPPIDHVEVEIEYSKDTSYLYIFGPSSTGKTVLISSILYYLKNNRSVEFGDTLKNLNNPEKKHEKEGSRLWNELATTLFENTFPQGTGSVKQDNPIPRHINAHLLTSNNKISDFKFCFIDMSGEDLHKVDHDREEQLPDVIKAYIESLPKENICFTYILDPKSDRHSKAEQLKVFNGFIDLLDRNSHTSTPLLFLISKWDLVSKTYTDAEEYLKKEYSPIWGTLSETARKISFAEFTIGEVNSDNTLIKKYNPKYAEKVFNWFYKNQTGDSLIAELNSKKKKRFKNPFKR
ncbi:hypothetical protein EVU94_13990 [Flavobacteriaceae bacterium 144Ye]|nr:hypothetical protein EVU94_13990 [Flavobacteriaceae bacterium 144Ye]